MKFIEEEYRRLWRFASAWAASTAGNFYSRPVCCVHTLPDFDREREQLEAGVGGRESGVDGMGEWRSVETFMENR